MEDLKIRVAASYKEVAQYFSTWANAESWNPGVYDANSFYAADPSGFFLGEHGKTHALRALVSLVL
jgi:hypothetical protein